jgi:hypothetical protein
MSCLPSCNSEARRTLGHHESATHLKFLFSTPDKVMGFLDIPTEPCSLQEDLRMSARI